MKRLYIELAKRQTIFSLFALFVAALFVFSFVSSAAAAELKTARADASEVDGTYSLMLYGCNNGLDVNNVAILKKEGDGRTFEIAGPSGAEPMVKTGLSGDVALAEAKKFLGCSVDVNHTQLDKIMSPEGTVLGFEVRPQYDLGIFGVPDAFSTSYTIKGDTVTARIIPDPAIENHYESGD
jgi:hypothetical protein